MDIMTETSKRIEELEEENKELKEKLDKCRKLLLPLRRKNGR